MPDVLPKIKSFGTIKLLKLPVPPLVILSRITILLKVPVFPTFKLFMIVTLSLK